MKSRLTRRQGIAFVVALAALVLCSLWLNQRLRAFQLQDKQALYAERLRAAQLILEDEMLAAAYLTSADPRTRERARFHFGRSAP